MWAEGQTDLIDRPSFFAPTLSLPERCLTLLLELHTSVFPLLAASLCVNCGRSGDGRKRVFDARELVWRDHAPQDLLESRFCRA